MELIWALLKVVEAIIGIVCLIIHVLAINDAEPMHHIVFYCGTFVGFTLAAVYGAICIIIHRGVGVTSEVIINFLGAIMYNIAAIWSMYHAEGDVHLQFLTDYEEASHQFFVHCRRQSIASLVCGCIYIMHCAFACDILITKASAIDDSIDETFEEAPQVLRLYFICPLVDKKLSQYYWFRKYSASSIQLHFDEISMKSSISSFRRISDTSYRGDLEKSRKRSRKRDSVTWTLVSESGSREADTARTDSTRADTARTDTTKSDTTKADTTKPSTL